MASVEMEPDLEPLRSARAKSGFLGVKITTSGKYQPQIFVKELGKQRQLGSYETAEEAAQVLARAKEYGPGWNRPIRKRAERDTVRCPAARSRVSCMLHLTGCLA